ncbi:MAG: choice-of-anchor E domain-containing protein, partial [Gammaproteobacteria bacterium]|nr:choice-of-anchor E domain-containing protein [Gammaproteobacteria bacterium]
MVTGTEKDKSEVSKSWLISAVCVGMLMFGQAATAIPIFQTKMFNQLNSRVDATSTYSTSTSGTSYLWSNNTVENILSFDGFDSNLGTLNSVKIEYETEYDNAVVVNAADWIADFPGYKDTANVSVSATAGLDIVLVDLSSYALASLADTNIAACTRTPTHFYFPPYTECTSNATNLDKDFSGELDLSWFSLSAFVGLNPIDIKLRSYANISGSCIGAEHN